MTEPFRLLYWPAPRRRGSREGPAAPGDAVHVGQGLVYPVQEEAELVGCRPWGGQQVGGVSFAALLRQGHGGGLSPPHGQVAPRGARTGRRTCGQDRPPPDGEAWPASPIPAHRTLPSPRQAGHRRSTVRLSALQPPSLLDTAAALPHARAFRALGVLRRLRPVPARSADDEPSPSTRADPWQRARAGTVPVFTATRSTK